MAKAPRRLGRGLSSLVSDMSTQVDVEQPASEKRGTSVSPESKSQPQDRSGLSDLPIAEIDTNPFQPRRNTEDADIASLAESIRQNGILQPITVRRSRGRYQIIAGERRWQACRQLGMAEVPAIVRDATDQEMLELALIENIHREDLNPIDRGLAYQSYCAEFRLSAEEVARRLGEDRTTVVNYIRLLDLSESIRGLVADGKISMGHARSLLGVADEARRLELAEAVVVNSLSVRALEDIVRRSKREDPKSAKPAADLKVRSAHIRDLEKRLEHAVKTKVTIKEGKRRGAGRIIIDYYSIDDFDRIGSLLGLDLD